MKIIKDDSGSLNEQSKSRVIVCKPTNEDGEYSDPDTCSSGESNGGGDADSVNKVNADVEDATNED